MKQFTALMTIMMGFIIAMALYAKAFVRYPVGIEQIMASAIACNKHLGVKEHLPADTPTGYHAICNDNTRILGEIRSEK